MTTAGCTHSPKVILLGASVRAAADSAARAGWTTWCADLFADRDLRIRADARAISMQRYPGGFVDLLGDVPSAPVVYTGALENDPDLIARIQHPLWGNSPDVLRAIRDPQQWYAALAEAGWPCPRISSTPQQKGQWLLKPRRSGAGIGIFTYNYQAFDSRTHFLQEWIDGTPVSALCIGSNDGVILVGVSEQLVGVPWLNATGFHYAGNVGPLPLAVDEFARWHKLADTLAHRFRLRGLFGIDAIVRDGVPWPIEINPRYTASVEIHERALGVALLHWHRAAFDPSTLSPWRPPPPSACLGKAVMYARETFAFPHTGPWMDSLAADAEIDCLAFADIPDAGTQIHAAQPVLTFFGSAPTPAECAAQLEEIASALARTLWA